MVATAEPARVGEREASHVAAAFLKQFVVDDLPWAHLDIAGTGMATKQMDWIPQGGTGFGVQLLVDWLLNRYIKSLVCHKHVTHHNTNYSRLPAEEPW